MLEIPPLANTFAFFKSHACLRNSKSGPSNVPSRLTLVKRNSVNPTVTNSFIELIKKIVSSVSIPVEIAGGLRSESLILEALDIVDRVVIGTFAFKEPQLLQKLLTTLGPEKIVISVDHKDGLIVTHGWQSTTDISLIDSMNEFVTVGFTEFLLTNVNRDGTLEGPDLEFLQQACDLKKANVIASGGISNIGDIPKVKQRNAWGVILGKALYENKITIQETLKLS